MRSCYSYIANYIVSLATVAKFSLGMLNSVQCINDLPSKLMLAKIHLGFKHILVVNDMQLMCGDLLQQFQ